MITWISQHKELLMTILGSTQLIQVISFIWNAVINKIRLKRLKDIVESIPKDIAEIRGQKTDITNLANCISLVNEKLDAIIEVQSIVYSTIKDPKARANVANILTSAKHLAEQTKAELINKLDSLKKELETQSKKSQENIQNVVEQAKQTMDLIR